MNGLALALALSALAPPLEDVAGLVVDEKGVPVEGVKVVATWPAEIHAESERQTRTTAADGAFSFEVDGERAAPRVTAFADGFVFQPIEKAEGRDLRLVGERVLEVRFDLVRPDGTPPGSARIRFEYPEETGIEPTTATWRGKRRRVLAAHKTATVTVYGDVYDLEGATGEPSRWRSEPLELDAATLASSTVEVPLVERNVLEIRVEGDEVATRSSRSPMFTVAKVDALDPNRPERGLRDAAVQFAGRGRSDLPRNGQTRYVFDLEPGEYCIGYFPDAFRLAESRTVTVGPGLTTFDFVLADTAAAGSITVRCEDPDGGVVQLRRYQLRVQFDRSSHSTSIEPSSWTDDGAAVFLRSVLSRGGVTLDGEPRTPDSITLTLEAAGYGQQTVDVLPDQDEYVVRFRVPVEITIRPVGEFPESLWLRESMRDGRMPVSFQPSKGEDVTLGPFQVESLTLEWVSAEKVQDLGFDRDGRPQVFVSGTTLGSLDFDLTNGERVYLLEAPRLFTVVVNAPDLDEGARVQLRPRLPEADSGALARGQRIRSERVTEGRVTLENVFAGTYTLRSHWWAQAVDVDVDGDITVDLPLVEATRLGVSITDPLGGLAACGLRLDDILVGSNGERFSSDHPARELYDLVLQEPVSVEVLRGDETIELELGPFESYAKMGGQFFGVFDQ